MAKNAKSKSSRASSGSRTSSTDDFAGRVRMVRELRKKKLSDKAIHARLVKAGATPGQAHFAIVGAAVADKPSKKSVKAAKKAGKGVKKAAKKGVKKAAKNGVRKMPLAEAKALSKKLPLPTPLKGRKQYTVTFESKKFFFLVSETVMARNKAEAKKLAHERLSKNSMVKNPRDWTPRSAHDKAFYERRRQAEKAYYALGKKHKPPVGVPYWSSHWMGGDRYSPWKKVADPRALRSKWLGETNYEGTVPIPKIGKGLFHIFHNSYWMGDQDNVSRLAFAAPKNAKRVNPVVIPRE